jgi:hypothetical protein
MSDEIKALFGQTFVGGGGYKRSREERRRSARGGAESPTYFACMKMDLPDGKMPNTAMQSTPLAQFMEPVVKPVQPMQPVVQQQSGPTLIGGAKMSPKMLEYKRSLENMNKDRLLKMAAAKGLKITKKKDGDTVYVKKNTLVRKLCECKMRMRGTSNSKLSKRGKGNKGNKGSKRGKGIKIAVVTKPASRKFMKRFSIF